MGDFQGHPFRGNQWTGGSSGPIDAVFSGDTDAAAREFWTKQLGNQSLAPGSDANKLLLSHEAPGDQVKTFRRTGVREGFATVGAPSTFVTGEVKTRVWFNVRYSDAENVTPDMRYDADQPYLDALRQNGGKLRGVDVSFNFDVPASEIARIELIRGGETTVAYEGKNAWEKNPPRRVGK
jgi:hypothetical protein